MRKKILQRGLAMVLSAAMLLTGIQIPSMTAEAAESVVCTDTMDSKEGWVVTLDDGIGSVTNEIKSANGTTNATNAWSIWSEKAQTITFGKTVNDIELGDYIASVEIVGGSIEAGSISICEGAEIKGTKNMESFGS